MVAPPQGGGGISVAQLQTELDDATRNLARIRTLTNAPANQTTTSTTVVSLATWNILETTDIPVDAVFLVDMKYICDISNSAAGNTTSSYMIGGYGDSGNRSYASDNVGTAAITVENRTSVAHPQATADVVRDNTGPSNTLQGKVSAGTGTYANITLTQVYIRGA